MISFCPAIPVKACRRSHQCQTRCRFWLWDHGKRCRCAGEGIGEKFGDAEKAKASRGASFRQRLSASRQQEPSDWQVGGLTTGFPVPLYYTVPRRLAQQGSQGSRALQEKEVEQDFIKSKKKSKAARELQPVFRAAPYRAERERNAQSIPTTRLLFIDEGNLCRSVLAEAMFMRLLASTRVPLDVTAESASIGPAADGPHDPRVVSVAREAGLPLPPRQPRVFDELRDIVQYDLVLVMDKFDMEAVLREVAVFDKINPGGRYAARVKQLGSYATAGRAVPLKPAQSDADADISDPLWGNLGCDSDTAALWRLLRQLRLASKGLLTHLLELNSRYLGQLQYGVSQALHTARPEPATRRPPAQQWRPVWRETLDNETGNLYTIRVSNGARHVVKRPQYSVTRGFWRDVRNIEAEVSRWIQEHGQPGKMPTCGELRATSSHSLESAIRLHGGQQAIAARMGLATGRHANGYWRCKENLMRELEGFLTHWKGPDGLAPGTAQATESGGQQQQQSSRAMPRLGDLQKAGRYDLMGAVQLWGGVERVAELFGLRMTYTSRRRRRKLGLPEVFEAVRAVAPGTLLAGYFPTRLELLMAGHEVLVSDIQALGGVKRVAGQLGLEYKNASPGQHAAVDGSLEQRQALTGAPATQHSSAGVSAECDAAMQPEWHVHGQQEASGAPLPWHDGQLVPAQGGADLFELSKHWPADSNNVSNRSNRHNARASTRQLQEAMISAPSGSVFIGLREGTLALTQQA